MNRLPTFRFFIARPRLGAEAMVDEIEPVKGGPAQVTHGSGKSLGRFEPLPGAVAGGRLSPMTGGALSEAAPCAVRAKSARSGRTDVKAAEVAFMRRWEPGQRDTLATSMDRWTGGTCPCLGRQNSIR